MATARVTWRHGVGVSRGLRVLAAMLFLLSLLAASAVAWHLPVSGAEPQRDAASGVPEGQDGATAAEAIPDSSASFSPEGPTQVFDLTVDSTGVSASARPDARGRCYVYDRYVVIAWDSPDPLPVAIVRGRDGEGDAAVPECSPDSLPGDFVLRNDWAEYFCGMWGDLLLIDSGTGDIRSLILYDVPTRRKVLELEGAGETEGWIDESTVRIWMLGATDLPRSVCPDIPEIFGVGVDSLYALNLETLRLTPLGPWRCHVLQ